MRCTENWEAAQKSNFSSATPDVPDDTHTQRTGSHTAQVARRKNEALVFLLWKTQRKVQKALNVETLTIMVGMVNLV